MIYLSVIIPISAIFYILILEFFIVRAQIKKDPTNETRIRKVVTRDYLLGLSRSNFLNIVLAFSTALIALTAVQLSVTEGNNARLHDHLSVKPHLSISYFTNDKEAGFHLHSTGLGPAVIKWMTVSVDAVGKDSWDEVTKVLGFKGPVNYNFGYLFPGNVVKTDFVSTLYGVQQKKDILKLNDMYSKVEIVICYCSVYGELDGQQCWQTSTDLRSDGPRCDGTPKLLFPVKSDYFDSGLK